MEGGVELDLSPRLHIGNAVAFGPVNLEILDHRDADAGDPESLHHLLQPQRVESLAIRGLSRFDAGDERPGIVLTGGAAGGEARNARPDQQDAEDLTDAQPHGALLRVGDHGR